MTRFEREEIFLGTEIGSKESKVKYVVVGSNKNLKIENEINKHVYKYIKRFVSIHTIEKKIWNNRII